MLKTPSQPQSDDTRPNATWYDLKQLAVSTLRDRPVPLRHRPAVNAIEPTHGWFGAISLRDWQRWTYKHTDHHLRQFGL